MGNFVSVEQEDNALRLQNLYYTAVFIGFVWILFHFMIIFFFGMVLNSVFLVGLFLGIGNAVAMFSDIPVGVLQRYIKSKDFLLLATFMMFLVCLIFLKFVYFEGISQFFLPDGGSSQGKIVEYSALFLDSGLNIVLLLLASCFYGLVKESYDVTTLSYIFNLGTPSEYASMISKYNIRFGIGSMIGLIFSGILLALDVRIATIVFTIIILLFLAFIKKYFDNNAETVEFGKIKKIKNLKLDVLKTDFLRKKDELISKITPTTLINLSKQSKVILLKPMEIRKNIDFKEIYEASLDGFKTFAKIVFGLPRNLLVLWFLAVILQYGFWDTFVSTFQVEFLEKIISLNSQTALVKDTKGLLTGYVLLGLMVIPAFLLQDFFINLSKKIGVYKVVMFGLLISSISLFFFGIFKDIYLVLLCGLINSAGYAASMPLSQATFGGLYNEDYAKKFNLTQIDSAASSAPLKIVLNSANVIGLILGAALVGILGFNMFFVFFSFILGGFFIYSLINRKLFSSKESGQEPTANTEDGEEGANKAVDTDFV